VDPRLTASLTGIVMGIGEVLGGVLSPFAAGALSDAYGRSAVLWMMLGLTILAALVGFGLRETAPRVLAARNKGGATATA
jgi:cyanate permease